MALRFLVLLILLLELASQHTAVAADVTTMLHIRASPPKSREGSPHVPSSQSHSQQHGASSTRAPAAGQKQAVHAGTASSKGTTSRSAGSASKTKTAWWAQKGGKPRAAAGTSPRYEINKKAWERRKARNAAAKKSGSGSTSEHPPSHGRHPSGPDKPGSPGGGSHAVT